MKRKLDVVAALIEKEGKILLCQRKEDDRYGLLWEFPGGLVERGEDYQRAIRREMKEELDIEIEVKRFFKEFFDEDEELKIKIFLFVCCIKSGMPQALDCRDFGFFALKEIEELNLAPADKKIFSYLKKIR